VKIAVAIGGLGLLLVLGTVGVLALLAANSGSGGDPGWTNWDDSCPAWSPDGKRIAFASTRADYGHDKSGWYLKGESLDSYAQGVVSGYTYDLYVMNADGSGVRRLTRLAGRTRPQPRHQRSVDQSAPVWSRDGRVLYFTVTSPEKQAGDSEVGAPSFRRGTPYAVNSTGTPTVRRAGDRELAALPRYPAYDYNRQDECAARSPRRDELAFYRPVDIDVGAGGGFGMVGIICVETAAGKPETLTQGLGKPCPDTRVS
jgi:Tol biopolymer transport system component